MTEPQHSDGDTHGEIIVSNPLLLGPVISLTPEEQLAFWNSLAESAELTEPQRRGSGNSCVAKSPLLRNPREHTSPKSLTAGWPGLGSDAGQGPTPRQAPAASPVAGRRGLARPE